MPTISPTRSVWKSSCSSSRDRPEVDLAGGWAVLFGGAGAPIGKRADPAAHAAIARWPLYSFKLIHPTFMGKTSWFRRYLYRADAIRCEDHDLLFRACADSRFANLPEIVLGYRQGSINLRKCSALALDVVALRGALSGQRRAAAGGGGGGTEGAAATSWRWRRMRIAPGCARAYAALNEEESREWQQVWDSVS